MDPVTQLALFFHVVFIKPLFWQIIVFFFPFLLIIELPLYLIVFVNVLYSAMTQTFKDRSDRLYFPLVTCVITAYNEGRSIQQILYSLLEQRYPGPLEILVVLDNAPGNRITQQAIIDFIAIHPNSSHRHITFLAKKTRGGHASGINLGLKMAKGEYLLLLDGDSSCDNDVLSVLSEHFMNKNIIGISGTLRVRNVKTNILTRFQSIEYSLAIGMSRLGLSTFKTLNIISGAFGLYRRDFLIKIGGWKNGSAEDLDLTLRTQTYFHDHPELKLEHDPRAIVHTDVPDTLKSLLKQRFRWEGDMFFIYCRRHWRILRPKFLGWRLFFSLIWYGFLLQMVLPITTLFYVSFLIFTGQLTILLFSLILAYVYYFSLTTLLFMCYIIIISERKSLDCRLIPCLFLMPVYQFFMRLWAGVALLYEMVFNTHLDTTMAPYTIARQADKD